jgi:hypothetical protein
MTGDQWKEREARLEAIETRLGALPPGEWTIEEHGGPGEFALYAGRGPMSHGYNLVHLSEWAHQRPAVEAVIVNAPSDLAWLLRLVTGLQGFAADAGELMNDAIRDQIELGDAVRRVSEALAREAAQSRNALVSGAYEDAAKRLRDLLDPERRRGELATSSVRSPETDEASGSRIGLDPQT